MNELQVGRLLRNALTVTGRDEWELSRRADVKLCLVEALLAGTGAVPLSAVLRVAAALELDMQFAPAQPGARSVGSVPTLVDIALDSLNRRHVERPPPAPASVASFLSEQRALLDRLEALTRSGAYERLLVGAELHSGAPEPWMAGWLLRPHIALGRRPIDLLDADGGPEVIAQILAQDLARSGT